MLRNTDISCSSTVSFSMGERMSSLSLWQNVLALVTGKWMPQIQRCISNFRLHRTALECTTFIHISGRPLSERSALRLSTAKWERDLLPAECRLSKKSCSRFQGNSRATKQTLRTWSELLVSWVCIPECVSVYEYVSKGPIRTPTETRMCTGQATLVPEMAHWI